MNNKHVRNKFVGLVDGLDASSPDAASWLDGAVAAIDKMADNDKNVEQFRDELSEGVGYDTPAYRIGIETFIHEAAVNGDLTIAGDNALNAAGLRTRSTAVKKSSSDDNWLSKFGRILKDNFGK